MVIFFYKMKLYGNFSKIKSYNNRKEFFMENDKVLYEKFLNGNKDAFNELILKYKNELLYFILKYVKNMEFLQLLYMVEPKLRVIQVRQTWK